MPNLDPGAASGGTASGVAMEHPTPAPAPDQPQYGYGLGLVHGRKNAVGGRFGNKHQSRKDDGPALDGGRAGQENTDRHGRAGLLDHVAQELGQSRGVVCSSTRSVVMSIPTEMPQRAGE